MNRNLPTYEEAEAHNKLSHFTVQGYDLNGIVHAGANDGEEMDSAIRMGIENLVAFEPLPSAFDILSGRYGHKVHCYKLGLHNKDTKATLQVTAGDGKGSSIYETEWAHPEVLRNWTQGQAAVVAEEVIRLEKFTTWAKKHPNIDLRLYDTLQLDTQGNEMEILQGMGKLLQRFKYLAIEISEVPVYKGETPGQEIIDWLDKQDFLCDSPLTAHNDTFFIRKDIKSVTDGLYKGRC